MGKFEIYKDKRGEFRFRLKASNGQTILTGQGYKGKASCENGVDSVRKNSTDESRFEKLEAKDGRPYFNLKSSNGQVIGNSQMYASMRSMKKGIASVGKNAPDAKVDDQA